MQQSGIALTNMGKTKDWSPELYEVGPYEWWAEERHHKFGDGCVCCHRPPPNLCEESLQYKFSFVLFS